MNPIIIYTAVFLGVAATIGALSFIMSGDREAEVEERLSVLTSGKKSKTKGDSSQYQELLAAMKSDQAGGAEKFVSKYLNLRLLFDQADVSFPIPQFLMICGGLAVLGLLLPSLAGFNVMLGPVMAAFLAVLPLLWLLFRRKRRMKKFASQLPQALELIARALRAGHSLASGFSLVANEMSQPIGGEFSRTFEEQNLGKPLEEALNDLAKRVPNLDLKFFATAIILQRQTGGDLAEILDKIGHLIRERFKIWGQVQALTGEGRLSGVVLLALPPVLFLAVYNLNPQYAGKLFTDPMGQQMLLFAAVLQVLGALVIRKIVNIKV